MLDLPFSKKISLDLIFGISETVTDQIAHRFIFI